MKQGNLIFNILVGIAIVVLYILHFTNNQEGAVIINGSDSTGVIAQTTTTAVYVNGDSLLENYEYFKKAKKDFEARTIRTENEINAKRNALEKEFTNYQQTGASLSADQRARIEESLVRKEQELRLFSENAANKLQEEQAKFNEQLFDKVSAYLKDYTKDKSYKIVLNFTKGSGILYANDSLDITHEVLKGLNEQYKKEKK